MNPKWMRTKEQEPREEEHEFYNKGWDCRGLGKYREQMLKNKLA